MKISLDGMKPKELRALRDRIDAAIERIERKERRRAKKTPTAASRPKAAPWVDRKTGVEWCGIGRHPVGFVKARARQVAR